MELERLRAQWRDRGFSFDVFVDPPGQVWRDFVHETDELLLLLEGEIEIEAGGRCWRPETGVEVLIAAGTVHSVANTGTTANRWAFGYRYLPL